MSNNVFWFDCAANDEENVNKTKTSRPKLSSDRKPKKCNSVEEIQKKIDEASKRREVIKNV